jgi:hypothetical protein
MAPSNCPPPSIEDANSSICAFNDNGGGIAEIQACTRILVALQDPEARRQMSRVLRAKGFRVIALDEPVAVWSMVADYASPCLAGFDFVICGGFRSDGKGNEPRASQARFFLLLGRGGFVPFAADGTEPPAWAFRRAGTRLVRDTAPVAPQPIRRLPVPRHPAAAPGHLPQA